MTKLGLVFFPDGPGPPHVPCSCQKVEVWMLVAQNGQAKQHWNCELIGIGWQGLEKLSTFSAFAQQSAARIAC